MATAFKNDAAHISQRRSRQAPSIDLNVSTGADAEQPHGSSKANDPPGRSSPVADALDARRRPNHLTVRASWPSVGVEPSSVYAAEPASHNNGDRPSRGVLMFPERRVGDNANSKCPRDKQTKTRKAEWFQRLYGDAAAALRSERQVIEVAIDTDAIVRDALNAPLPPYRPLCEDMSVPFGECLAQSGAVPHLQRICQTTHQETSRASPRSKRAAEHPSEQHAALDRSVLFRNYSDFESDSYKTPQRVPSSSSVGDTDLLSATHKSHRESEFEPPDSGSPMRLALWPSALQVHKSIPHLPVTSTGVVDSHLTNDRGGQGVYDKQHKPEPAPRHHRQSGRSAHVKIQLDAVQADSGDLNSPGRRKGRTGISGAGKHEQSREEHSKGKDAHLKSAIAEVEVNSTSKGMKHMNSTPSKTEVYGVDSTDSSDLPMASAKRRTSILSTDSVSRPSLRGSQERGLSKRVPISLTTVSSWWEVCEVQVLQSDDKHATSWLPEGKDKQTAFDLTGVGKGYSVKREDAFANNFKVHAVTEVHDMRAFGSRRSLNTIAFRHQEGCGGHYFPWLLFPEDSTLQRVTCDAAMLAYILNKVKSTLEDKPVSGSWSVLPRIGPFCSKECRLLRAMHTVWKTFTEAAAESGTENFTLLLNKALSRTPDAPSALFALTAHLLECRASIPYEHRRRNGFPVLKADEVPPFLALTGLNKNGADVLIPTESPESFDAVVRPPDDYAKIPEATTAGASLKEKRHLKRKKNARLSNRSQEPWRLPLYKAFAILTYFSLHMYHIGTRPFDYKYAHLNDVFPKPWRVTYLGTVAWTEWTPFWSPKENLTPDGKRMLEKYKLKLTRRWWTPFGRWKTVIIAGPNSPKRTKQRLRPFSVDFCLHDAAYAAESRSPMFVRLDNMDRFHTAPSHNSHKTKQTIRHPPVQDSLAARFFSGIKWILTRVYSLPSRSSLEEKTAGATSETTKSHHESQRSKSQGRCATTQRHTNPKEAPGKKTRRRLRASAQATPRLSVHAADTLWVFKGTDNAKTWTLNLMIDVIKDETFSSKGRVHHGFATLFHNVLRKPLTRFLREAARRAAGRSPENPYVVVFTGHSLGGSLSALAAWFVAKHLRYFVESRTLVVYCVTFGAPSIGDRAAVEELEAAGLKIFRLVADIDPVPLIGQTEGWTDLYKSKKEIVLHVDDMQGVTLRGSHGQLLFSGAIWMEDKLQPRRAFKQFLDLAADHLKVSQFTRKRSSPLSTHLHFLPCALSIMTGSFVTNGWSSFCASPLLTSWPLFPTVLSAEAEVEMKRVHETVLPTALQSVEEREKKEDRRTRDRDGKTTNV